MIPRLYVAGDHQPGDTAALSAEQAHYLSQVLRLPAQAPLEIFDGRGNRFSARLLMAQRQRGEALIEAAVPGIRLGRLRITLIQGISAADKMDWTIEKATELGVERIVPMTSQRSKIKLDATRAARRVEHWHRLINAACMQCGRDDLVRLNPIIDLNGLSDVVAADDHRLVLTPPLHASREKLLSGWAPEIEQAAPLRVALLVGPESGLDDEEIAHARSIGFAEISLGPRILRTETAGLAAIAALQTRFGDM